MSVEKIRKRDGVVVEFDASKISIAIKKAVDAVRGGGNVIELDNLTRSVVDRLNELYSGSIADVEGVQDIVEQCLMKNGYYDVARAYILYRERRAQIRNAKKNDTMQKISDRRLFITNSKGVKEIFDEDILKSHILSACRGFEGVVNIDEMLLLCESSLYEGIPTSEISKLAVFTARGLIEVNPVYDTITSRLALTGLYKEAGIGGGVDYSQAFINNIKRGVDIGRLDSNLMQFDLNALASRIDSSRDELLPYRGIQTLYDRYFIYDQQEHRRIETPQMFWMRVSMGLALNEKDKESMAIKFYEVLSRLEFVSSTPTLFHSGTMHPQMSSCYLTTVEDDLHGIFKSFSDNAQLSKWSGGLGNDWSNIRATGSFIKSTAVESQGVIPFLKIANDVTVAINRSGKRRGATCAYLEAWHFDIEEFLELRKNTGDERRRTHDMSTALWVPDLLLKRVISDGDWSLFSPEEVPDLHHIYGAAFESQYKKYEEMGDNGKLKIYKKIKARDLWRKAITMLFETGHPWITFKDPSNIRSPQDHVGVVHCSNLCTEITLNTSKDETAVCNLGSINLAKHINGKELDVQKLSNTVKIAMRMLDNVIDLNFYPTQEAKNSNMLHRPVGLGIMGFQDALYMMDINFDSEDAVKFADYSMEIISYNAILGSSILAKERGPYASYKGSKWDRGILPIDTMDILEKERGVKIDVSRDCRLDWGPVRESIRQNGMRNSNCMAIAPTATISNIAGCFPSIEPIYNGLYVKSNMSGEFTVVDHYLVEDLKKIGLWNKHMLQELKEHEGNIQEINSIPTKIKEKYKNAFDIDPQWLIRIAAYRGKWIDQSQSLNIFAKTTSGKKLSDIYIHAWQMGLKTTYYLRTLGASAIEKSTVEISRQKTKASNDGELVIAQSVSAPSAVVVLKDQEVLTQESIKSCKLEDPDCESCQ